MGHPPGPSRARDQKIGSRRPIRNRNGAGGPRARAAPRDLLYTPLTFDTSFYSFEANLYDTSP